LFIERQQGIPIDPPDSPRSHGGQVKGCPWGWNRPYFKALLPFPRAVFGFCSPWAETPTARLIRTLRRSCGQSLWKTAKLRVQAFEQVLHTRQSCPFQAKCAFMPKYHAWQAGFHWICARGKAQGM